MLLIALMAVALDQGTKIWSKNNLLIRHDPLDSRVYQGSRHLLFQLGEPIETVLQPATPSWLTFQLNYVRNHGAAWGSFSNLDESIRLPLFHVLTVVFCAFFLGMALTNRAKLSVAMRLALVLMVSGAIGNLIDRVWHGFVVDLFDLRWQVFSWRYALPVFNLADVCVVVGLLLLVILAIRR